MFHMNRDIGCIPRPAVNDFCIFQKLYCLSKWYYMIIFLVEEDLLGVKIQEIRNRIYFKIEITNFINK